MCQFIHVHVHRFSLVRSRSGILVLAATNRIEAVDGALLRPGRFDVLLEVPLPSAEGRLQVSFKLEMLVMLRIDSGGTVV